MAWSTGTGIFLDGNGNPQFGPTINGTHNWIDMDKTGYPPKKGWILIGTLHTHPPDPNPNVGDPATSPLDPDNSNQPVGASGHRVPCGGGARLV